MHAKMNHAVSFARHQGTQPIRVLAAAIALALGAAAPACADTFVATDQATLVQAIDDANANPGADAVSVGADILLTAALPTITEALVIEGSGGNRTIARDNSGDNACSPTASNAFRPLDASADLTLRNLTLSGGCNLVDQGGAVRVQGAALRLERSTISGNQTFVENAAYTYGTGGMGGGAVALYGSISVIDSVISDNHTHGMLAGGGGITSFYGDVEVANSTISGNSVEGLGAFGGGLYAVGRIAYGIPGTLTIASSVISNNELVSEGDPQGGGVTAFEQNVTITDSSIDGNRIFSSATEGLGGRLLIGNWSPVDIRFERTRVIGNSVESFDGWGGGVYIAASSDVVGDAVVGTTFTMIDSTVAHNTVDTLSKGRAGGLFISAVQARMINTTVANNEVNGPVYEGGGAMMLLSEFMVPIQFELYNSTVANNKSLNSDAGGLFIMREPTDAAEPTILLESSILANNVGYNGLADIGISDMAAPAVVANHSLIQGSVRVGEGSFTADSTTMMLRAENPQLQPLAFNGGTTPTLALAANSPALDQGSNTQALPFDQRGAPYARVVGVAIDIGAVEYDADRIFASWLD